MKDTIKARIEQSIEVKEDLHRNGAADIERAARLIMSALRTGGKVLLFGNGGSAADCQHIAAELVGRFKKERQALAAIALTTNTSTLTAIANDYGYDVSFSRQVEALAKEGDVAVGISTSGKSKNVTAALAKARSLGAKTIGLTGASGAAMKDLCDCLITVSSKDTARIQEAHILIGHIICELVEGEFAK
ncbi:MAG: D-sedoheptulose 7-phosphate isomerase [Candidatus Omnitrophica bacterium]|nr:D-sedoheptulose 7-phosphate isomerase [Candidatus Omnitrophota bacterium]MDD5437449.1 D-sedoheptulose 7-phosphate isomerase [Candidatus Omnitrophota bacterium]